MDTVGVSGVRVSAQEVAERAPRLRGWLHLGASPLALIGGLVLALASPDARTQVGSAIFTAAALLNFLASAALHLGSWPPRAAPYVRRIDHASIFVLIAGSYTPFTLLMLTVPHQVVLLWLAWGGATLGVVFRLVWSTAPRWLYTMLYLVLGWGSVLFLTDFADYTPIAVPLLLAAGGALYTAGGVVYAVRRPNPSPGWFGFHEVFHALTIAAFACQYAGVLIATISRRPG
ncbi:DNA-binding protein [Marmoricola endophyticus]|uniref:DNA-binding protein n=1 Tax=Marmoricola endophyticus TaxID=2040280 RepID=A0A917BEN4_9ACTN|nr:hemolysin III family protein [Marmoricola endophyticus]GGF35005.1 DNA-binding protein [Marmoricola endophyticus]